MSILLIFQQTHSKFYFYGFYNIIIIPVIEQINEECSNKNLIELKIPSIKALENNITKEDNKIIKEKKDIKEEKNEEDYKGKKILGYQQINANTKNPRQ